MFWHKWLTCQTLMHFAFCFVHFSDSPDDINLLAAVGSPLPPDVRPVTGPFGRFGRPAVEFTPQSYVGRWAKDILPIPFYFNFGIKVTIYMQSIKGGVLFTVLEMDHSNIILGLQILRYGQNNQSLELTYQNKETDNTNKQLVVRFVLPDFSRRWTVFSISVVGNRATLYFNGCQKVFSQNFATEQRRSLSIGPKNPIFLGMSGWYIQKPPLFVSIRFLDFY